MPETLSPQQQQLKQSVDRFVAESLRPLDEQLDDSNADAIRGKVIQASKEADQKLIDAYKKAGVKVAEMTAEQAALWRKIADTSSYKDFAENVKGGRELLDMALSVE